MLFKPGTRVKAKDTDGEPYFTIGEEGIVLKDEGDLITVLFTSGTEAFATEEMLEVIFLKHGVVK